MTYQIDQSGKIEQTNIDTILALTNGRQFTVLLKKKDKRILEKTFKKIGKIQSYPFVVFAALLAMLIKLSRVTNAITIDREYTGHENTIRERVLYFLHNLGIEYEIIIGFGHVGKLSKAHDVAAKVGSKKLKPNKVVNLNEVLELVFEIKAKKETEVN